MIFARCPACQTVFRVRPEQLRAHQGAVRCGHCYTPFDALANLIEEAAPERSAEPPAAPPSRPAPQAAERAAPSHVTPVQTDRPSSAAPLSEQEFVSENEPFIASEATENARQAAHYEGGNAAEPVSRDATPREHGHPSPAQAPAPFENPGDRLDFEIPDHFLPTSRSTQAAANAYSGAASLGDVRQEPSEENEASGEAPLDFTAPPEPPLRRRSPLPPDAAPAPRPPEPEYGEMQDAPEQASPLDAATELPALWVTPPASTAPLAGGPPHDEVTEEPVAELAALPSRSTGARGWWALGVGLLLGALAVQAAYLFRAELTRDWPGLRPAFLAACEQLGCTIELSRFAGAISIEASDLQSEPDAAARFILNATVRNRATHVQAFPHLELTLTDARDRPLVRRVFSPEEWVDRENLDAGFAAGEEVAVRLPFSAPEIEPAGYRVYVFYP